MTVRLQAGWLGLPILALLLIVAGLSAAAQTQFLSDYQWRSEVQQQASIAPIWQSFILAKVTQAQFNQAEPSACEGFCALNETQASTNQFQYDGQLIRYQWQYVEGGDEGLFYRLCATNNQQDYYCWWWHERRLHSQAWVSLPD